MAFTKRIRPRADEIWTAIVEHPMVAGIGDGTLQTDRFKYWVRQDYQYLIEYGRLFALGAAKAPTFDRMKTFTDLLTATLTEEMDLHRSYAAEFGIIKNELEATPLSPTTQGYTDFLLRTAALGSFTDLVVALLPCMWGFNDVATRLAADGLPGDERYAAWIEMYTGEEFSELTEWCLTLSDEMTAEATETEIERCRRIFETSAQYEYRFWDATWRREEWTV